MKKSLFRISALILGLGLSFIAIEGALQLGSLIFSQDNSHTEPAANDTSFSIYCFGDSFTRGLGANTEESYPAQLQRKIDNEFPANSVHVYNFGRSGYNTTRIKKLFLETIHNRDVDLVILLCGKNNLWDFKDMPKEYLRTPRYLSSFFSLKTVRLASLISTHMRKRTMNKEAHSSTPEGQVANITYNEKGWELKDSGHFIEAIEYFKAALQNNPQDGNAFCGIAWAYEQQGRYQTAIEWFKKGIVHAPRYINNYYGLAQVYSHQSKQAEAFSYFSSIQPPNHHSERLARYFKNRDTFQERILEWTQADILSIIKLCKRNRVPIMLQSYPESHLNQDLARTLHESAKSENIPFIDHTTRFADISSQAATRSQYFTRDFHCTAKGYAIMADTIFTHIIQAYGTEWAFSDRGDI